MVPSNCGRALSITRQLVTLCLALCVCAAAPPGCATKADVEDSRKAAVLHQTDLEKAAAQREDDAKALETETLPKLKQAQDRIAELERVIAGQGGALDAATRQGILNSKAEAERAVAEINANVAALRSQATHARDDAKAEAERIAGLDKELAAEQASAHTPSVSEQLVAGVADHLLPGLGTALAVGIPLLLRGNFHKSMASRYAGKAVAGVKVIDALEEVKLADPMLKEILKKNADKLGKFMGADGLAFVEEVQKAGNSPLAAPVI